MSLQIPLEKGSAIAQPANEILKLLNVTNKLLVETVASTTYEEFEDDDGTTHRIPIHHRNLMKLLEQSHKLVRSYSELTHDIQSQDFRDKIAAFDSVQRSKMVPEHLKKELAMEYFKHKKEAIDIE